MSAIRKMCMADGGPIKGPGTGTSDSIPIAASAGEFIMPADSVRKIGVKVLTAMRDATHKMVDEGKGAVRKMANGGMVKKYGYADGGMVEDERRKNLIAQIPTDTAGFAPGTQPTATGSELGRNVRNTLAALPGAAPALGAIGTLAAASRAAPVASSAIGGVSTLAAPVAPYAVPAGGLAALNSASAPAAPAVQTPAIQTAPTRTDVQRGGAIGQLANVPQPVATPQSTAFDPSITKTVEGGRTTYSNVTGDTAFAARGTPSAKNFAAADALSARYAGAGAAQFAQEQAAKDALAYAAQDKQQQVNQANSDRYYGELAGQNANVKSILATRGLSADQQARLENARAIATENNATSRLNNQDSNATSAGNVRYSTDATSANAQAINQLGVRRLALDAQTHSQDANLKAGQIRLAAQTESARNAVLTAKTPEEKVAAEERLTVLLGKQKEVPELYSTTAIPGGVDPVTGATRGAGAIVTNRRTGETRIISADEAKGQAAPKFETGKVYQDAKGNKAKWDGSKFVPA